MYDAQDPSRLDLPICLPAELSWLPVISLVINQSGITKKFSLSAQFNVFPMEGHRQ